MPNPESKSPSKALWLRPLRSNNSGPLAVGTNMKSKGATARPPFNAKVSTVSVQSRARRLVVTTVAGQTSRNITPSFQQQIQRKQATDLENCKTISAARIDTRTSIPKLKLVRQKRVSIIPKTGVISLFSPEPIRVRDQCEVISDAEYDSSPTPCSRHPETSVLQKYLDDHSSKEVPQQPSWKPSKTQSSVTLPNRRLEREDKKKVSSKSVRWDPAIVNIEPARSPTPDEQPMSAKSDVDVSALDRDLIGSGLDAKVSIETIKEWKKSDRERLEYILRALRELDTTNASCDIRNNSTESNGMEEITVREIKSLDPRVPDFQPFGNLKSARELSRPISILQPHENTSAKECPVQNKENIPPQIATTALSLRRGPGRKRSICDDHRAPGREVNAFDQWYAEKQLIEFMKKYPLTGKKAPVVKKQILAQRRAEIMATSGPTAGRHAAIIQQRLEFLLLKNKEKKALERKFS